MTEHHRTAAWARTVRRAKPIIAASLPAPCVDCGRAVMPDQKWQVGHIVAASLAARMGWTTEQINALTNLGPSHTKGPNQRPCNQIAGGRLGAQKANQRRTPKVRWSAW